MLAALSHIIDPDFGQDIVTCGFVKDLAVDQASLWCFSLTAQSACRIGAGRSSAHAGLSKCPSHCIKGSLAAAEPKPLAFSPCSEDDLVHMNGIRRL